MTNHDIETPAHGQQIITAVAFIHKNDGGINKVFLAKRADTKKFLPGVYEMPGGHIDYGEDIIDGLKREIMEELGMETIIGEPFAVFTYVNEIKGSHSIEVAYFANFVGDDSSIVLDPADHSESGWFSVDEIEATRSNRNPKDDPEYKVIAKGFNILNG